MGSEAGLWARTWAGFDQQAGMDAAQPLGPGPAQQLHQDGLGLVVQGVRGEDGVGVAVGDELPEEVVAKVARSLLDGLGPAVGARVKDAVWNAGVADVQRNFEAQAERLTKARSASASSPRRPWWTWTADSPTPSELRGWALAACSRSSRATESAPPETAAQTRSPGRMWVRSSVGSGFAIVTNGTARRRCGGGWRHIYGSSRGTLVILRWLCESLWFFRRLGLGRGCPWAARWAAARPLRSSF